MSRRPKTAGVQGDQSVQFHFDRRLQALFSSGRYGAESEAVDTDIEWSLEIHELPLGGGSIEVAIERCDIGGAGSGTNAASINTGPTMYSSETRCVI